MSYYYFFYILLFFVLLILIYVLQPQRKKALEPSKHDINQNPIKMVITPKNKFLYPSDEFGMMEKGLVVDSKTYGDQLPEPTGDKTFEIIDKP